MHLWRQQKTGEFILNIGRKSCPTTMFSSKHLLFLGKCSYLFSLLLWLFLKENTQTAVSFSTMCWFVVPHLCNTVIQLLFHTPVQTGKKPQLSLSSRPMNDSSVVLIKSDCCFEAVTTAFTETEDMWSGLVLLEQYKSPITLIRLMESIWVYDTTSRTKPQCSDSL